MNTFTQNEVVNPQLDLIQVVKNQVDELYLHNQIFALSLETLELTRRFNIQYSALKDSAKIEASELSKFLALTQHLERNLLRELK